VRIRTRLFMLIAMLVLTLVGIQWWLGIRHIETSRDDLVTVATTVSHRLITELGVPDGARIRVTAPGNPEHQPVLGYGGTTGSEPPAATGGTMVVFTTVVKNEAGDGRTSPPSAAGTDERSPGAAAEPLPPGCEKILDQSMHLEVRRVGNGEERCLVITRPDGERRIPIPLAAPTHRALLDLQRGMLLSVGLLAAGLLAGAVIAHRVTGPLRQLAAGVEAVGRGGFQTRVPITGSGEVGDLQRSFNAMAERLATLESEREAWRAREHLAQLGDLARGLAHTLRNPLNTLGLAVDELAGRDGANDPRLVATARAQIRRVDRWLLSFLALGAGQGTETEQIDLAALAGEAVLEAVQSGANVTLEAPAEPVEVQVVPGALRAALANLVENAVQASPAQGVVTVSVLWESGRAAVQVADRGPGLPPEVRQRLFEPHVTTKLGGAGMGLFLARQLVEAGLGGRLDLGDRDGGGTVATITLKAREPAGSGHVS